eukprot:scaffold5177_cov73-Cyclotella_meneghiniana.AAC.7
MKTKWCHPHLMVNSADNIMFCLPRSILVHSFVPHIIPRIDRIYSLDKSTSPFDDLLGGIFGKGDKDKETEDDDVSLSSFQQELTKRQQNKEEIVSPPSTTNPENEDEEFSGYDLRDIIFYKYGECFDVQFQRVDSYGVRAVYLNIMPFRLGGKRFRHETEYDYLCHLQATVEILVKYNQLDNIIAQLMETDKKPRAGTSPLIAVPLRLDLTPEEVDKILG